MRVLALDAATEMCSVALQSGEEIIERARESRRSHAHDIVTMAQELLAEAGIAANALDGIAASIGPGAFTGVRTSVAVAQGIAFGAGLPAVPVTTLEALALQVLPRARLAVACLDARMHEVYWGCFVADATQGLLATTMARVDPPERLVLPRPPERHAAIGRGFAAYPMLAELPGVELAAADALALPRAREFARLGTLRLRLGGGVDPAALQPLYLRDKVALTEAERAAGAVRDTGV